ncbi:MAG: alpha/beta fold hydrolase [Gemmatimonadaceae bacterium]|nr:alpha/beta fold hydrolase [Gemmatimonadaceae bacterium]
MPHFTINGVSFFYEDTGGPDPAIVFSHGLLMSSRMFAAQIDALRGQFRCIAYDHRGQGRSSDPGGRVHDMDTCFRDAVAIIEGLDARPCHFVGLSMGGFVGMRLALRRPDLLYSLSLLETSAEPEPLENVPKYRRLALVAQTLGTRWVVDRVMPILFGRTFMGDPARAAERAEWRREIASRPRSIVRAVRGVIERDGVLDQVEAIRVPTLVVVGEEDTATPPPKARRIHEQIHGSRLVRIPSAGHSSSVEQPTAVTQALRDFFAALPK